MSAQRSTPAMAQNEVSYDEGAGEKLITKIKKNPMVPLGIAGMIGMVAYGGWNYRNRGNMKTSVYLMHFRVRAQSMVVGAMTLSVAYSLLNEYVFNKDKSE